MNLVDESTLRPCKVNFSPQEEEEKGMLRIGVSVFRPTMVPSIVSSLLMTVVLLLVEDGTLVTNSLFSVVPVV